MNRFILNIPHCFRSPPFNFSFWIMTESSVTNVQTHSHSESGFSQFKTDFVSSNFPFFYFTHKDNNMRPANGFLERHCEKVPSWFRQRVILAQFRALKPNVLPFRALPVINFMSSTTLNNSIWHRVEQSTSWC